MNFNASSAPATAYLAAVRPVSHGYKVDITRGERIGRVSSEWFSRPDDERYLSLSELYAAVRARADRARTRTVESRAIRVEASRDDAERLVLILPSRETFVAPTHWSFGQLCGLVGAPSGYLRDLPAPLAAINLQHGLLSHRAELVKTLEADDGRVELRAVTGPDYGRIWDHELVAAVMKIAGNGTGDTRWKVPGVLDWAAMTHNPLIDVTKDTTTLYASDRDVFLFLVDDTHPIEAGRLPNGDPDLYFRGFYCWNSEVGSKTLGIASFYLRAVCMNRNLWGVEGFEEISIRHSKFAAQRFNDGGDLHTAACGAAHAPILMDQRMEGTRRYPPPTARVGADSTRLVLRWRARQCAHSYHRPGLFPPDRGIGTMAVPAGSQARRPAKRRLEF